MCIFRKTINITMRSEKSNYTPASSVKRTLQTNVN